MKKEQPYMPEGHQLRFKNVSFLNYFISNQGLDHYPYLRMENDGKKCIRREEFDSCKMPFNATSVIKYDPFPAVLSRQR